MPLIVYTNRIDRTKQKLYSVVNVGSGIIVKKPLCTRSLDEVNI